MYREYKLKALLQGKTILIAGYGREGQSAERLIQRLVPAAQYTIADGNEQIAAEAAKGYDLIIKSPGVPMRVMGGAECSSLTDIFLQVYGDITIGVTGTKGKSTTASLIHHLLPGSILAGNIGIPLFDILDDLREDSIVVAELSCHQLENIHRGPHIAVLLNLFQEHLDHYENYMGYKMAKLQIALRQQSGDHFFYCTDNAELANLVAQHSAAIASTVHPYSINDISVDESTLLDACPLDGEHNRSNALVACRVAQLQSTAETFHETSLRLASFQGLRHRMEKIGVYKGITWYDDSISTIPAAAIAAVRALGRVDTLILGGFDRGIDYTPLVEFLKENPIKNLVFVGQAGRRIQKLLTPHSTLQTIVKDDYTKIVPWCAEHTPQGGVVLLSPAAASYDAFKNFEHRGDFFREQILKL
jgi:UDP-N-acetylmuramoylalanine--D-glutamate ligase